MDGCWEKGWRGRAESRKQSRWEWFHLSCLHRMVIQKRKFKWAPLKHAPEIKAYDSSHRWCVKLKKSNPRRSQMEPPPLTYPQMHVLQQEVGAHGSHTGTRNTEKPLGFKPKTLSMYGDGATHCTTLPLRLHYHFINCFWNKAINCTVPLVYRWTKWHHLKCAI